MSKAKDWKKAPLSPQYLLDAGLLYQINREFLHLLGISLVVQAVDGKPQIVLKDSREEPEKMLFEKSSMIMGDEKLKDFMTEFGFGQVDRRRKHLGWSVQQKHDGGVAGGKR